CRSADDRIGAVDRLEHVQVKLFSAGHADVEAVPLNRFVDALRVNRQDLLRALERRIVQCRTVDRTEDGLLFFGQRLRRAGEERRGEKLYLRHVIRFDDASAQSGAAVGNTPAFLVAGKLAVEDHGLEVKLLPRLPNERPTGATGDALAMTVSLRCAVNLRAGGNHQFAPV